MSTRVTSGKRHVGLAIGLAALWMPACGEGGSSDPEGAAPLITTPAASGSPSGGQDSSQTGSVTSGEGTPGGGAESETALPLPLSSPKTSSEVAKGEPPASGVATVAVNGSAEIPAVAVPSGGAATGGGGGAPSEGVANGGASGGNISSGGSSGGSISNGGVSEGGAPVGASPELGGNELWIGPAGVDSNSGTKDSPMASVSEAVKKMCGDSCQGKEGFTIWLLGGEYKPEKLLFISASFSGAEGKLNKLWAAPGEKPVFDCSATECVKDSGGTGQPCFFSHCLRVHASYWHVKGLEITKARDGGVLIAGSNNIIDRVYTHHNDDTGIQIDVFDDKMFGWVVGDSPIKEKVPNGGSNNLVVNCDSAFNYDEAKGGENADGFGAKKKKGEGNVFRGCRAWDNADDGYDFYEWESQITLEDSWAMNSSKGIKGSQSDGNGFKLGPGPAHKLSKCAATGNRARGFTYNGGSKGSSCTGCGSWSNGSGDNFGDIDVKNGPSAAEVIATERDAEGNLPELF